MATAVHPGAGLDATAAIQAAIDATSSAGPGQADVLIPYAAGNDWIVSSPATFTDSNQEDDPTALVMRSNQRLTLAPGVVLKAKADSFHGKYQALLGALSKDNIGLVFGAGSRIEMRKSDYQNIVNYTAAEWRHCLKIVGCSNVTIVGAAEAHLVSSGGDGLYIGPKIPAVRTPCSAVNATDVWMNLNHRQGCTVLSCAGLILRRCGFLNTSGTAPQSGLDLEPQGNVEDVLTDILVDDCRGYGNASRDFLVNLEQMSGTSQPVSITFRRCRSVPGALTTPWGFQAKMLTGGPPSGFIRFVDCTAGDLQYPGVRVDWRLDSAVVLQFSGCRVNRCGLIGGAERPIDMNLVGAASGYGVSFSDCRVDDTPARTACRVASAGGVASNVRGRVYLERLVPSPGISQINALIPNLDIVSSLLGRRPRGAPTAPCERQAFTSEHNIPLS